MSENKEKTGYPKIEPLTDSTWMPWKIKMESILRDKKLLPYVDGTKT